MSFKKSILGEVGVLDYVYTNLLTIIDEHIAGKYVQVFPVLAPFTKISDDPRIILGQPKVWIRNICL